MLHRQIVLMFTSAKIAPLTLIEKNYRCYLALSVFFILLQLHVISVYE